MKSDMHIYTRRCVCKMVFCFLGGSQGILFFGVADFVEWMDWNMTSSRWMCAPGCFEWVVCFLCCNGGTRFCSSRIFSSF